MAARETWIVTGAASGIGRAVARAAHAEGSTVVAVDLDKGGLQVLAGELPGIATVSANVAKPDDADRIIAAAGDQVDVLVNNAAIMDRMLLVDETPDELWERVVAVNLSGPFLLAKRALPKMREQRKGVIVNVASIAGLRGSFAGAAYTASKHGLIGLTKSIAYTYREDGIRSVCVCPGSTAHGSRGAMEEGTTFSELGFARIVGDRGYDPATLGKPEDVAAVILFAASDAARRINGTTLIADDGRVL